MPHHNESGYWWQGRTPGWRRWPPWHLLPLHLPRQRTAAAPSASSSSTGSWEKPLQRLHGAGHGSSNPEYTAGYPNALGDLQRHRRLR
jgi:hypothetical protein